MGAIFKNGKMYAGGVENVIEAIKVNGMALTVNNKAVNITIPSSLPAEGGNADTVGEKSAETIISEARVPVVNYTYVVNSNQALEDWANNVSGNDYTHVLIKAGTWNLTADTINLTATGTKTVTGEAGNLIVHDLTFKGIMYTMQYSEVPTSDVYNINGVNIKTINRITQTETQPPARGCVSFYKCTNLINCSAKGYTAYPVTGSNYYKGYSYCERLTNCFSAIDRDTITKQGGFFAGFDYCKYLTNCRAYNRNTSVNHFVGYGFNFCDYINGCDVYIAGASQQSNGYYKCNYISASSAYCASNSTAYSFNSCNYVASCNGHTSAAAGYGVTSCNYMSNCKVYSIGGSMTGYQKCNHLDNCVYSTSSVNGGVTGFSNCFGVRYCFAEITGTAGSATATCVGYSKSYASLAANDSFLCADTSEGGWNTFSKATS